MKVRMTVSMHGPTTAREAHEVHEVGDDEGARLIAAGFATAEADKPKPKPKSAAKRTGKAPTKRRETATAKPDAEER